MTNSQIIKAKGFKTKRINTNNFKGVFGGNCNHVIGLFNANNQILCIDDRPYFPAGKKNAFAALIDSGSINSKSFSFKKIS